MITWLRYRRWHRELFWGAMFEAFGGRSAPKGMLRSKRTVCKALKLAERRGYYC